MEHLYNIFEGGALERKRPNELSEVNIQMESKIKFLVSEINDFLVDGLNVWRTCLLHISQSLSIVECSLCSQSISQKL